MRPGVRCRQKKQTVEALQKQQQLTTTEHVQTKTNFEQANMTKEHLLKEIEEIKQQIQEKTSEHNGIKRDIDTKAGVLKNQEREHGVFQDRLNGRNDKQATLKEMIKAQNNIIEKANKNLSALHAEETNRKSRHQHVTEELADIRVRTREQNAILAKCTHACHNVIEGLTFLNARRDILVGKLDDPVKRRSTVKDPRRLDNS